jgi:hypothetical protein
MIFCDRRFVLTANYYPKNGGGKRIKGKTDRRFAGNRKESNEWDGSLFQQVMEDGKMGVAIRVQWWMV